jgi:hypothetical protein
VPNSLRQFSFQKLLLALKTARRYLLVFSNIAVTNKKIKIIIYRGSECQLTLTSSELIMKKHNGLQMNKMKSKQKALFVYLKIREILGTEFMELATIIKVRLIFLPTVEILGILVVVEDLIRLLKFQIGYHSIENKLIN